MTNEMKKVKRDRLNWLLAAFEINQQEVKHYKRSAELAEEKGYMFLEQIKKLENDLELPEDERTA